MALSPNATEDVILCVAAVSTQCVSVLLLTLWKLRTNSKCWQTVCRLQSGSHPQQAGETAAVKGADGSLPAKSKASFLLASFLLAWQTGILGSLQLSSTSLSLGFSLTWAPFLASSPSLSPLLLPQSAVLSSHPDSCHSFWTPGHFPCRHQNLFLKYKSQVNSLLN